MDKVQEAFEEFCKKYIDFQWVTNDIYEDATKTRYKSVEQQTLYCAFKAGQQFGTNQPWVKQTKSIDNLINDDVSEFVRKMDEALLRVKYKTPDYYQKVNHVISTAIENGLISNSTKLISPENPRAEIFFNGVVRDTEISITF